MAPDDKDKLEKKLDNARFAAWFLGGIVVLFVVGSCLPATN